MKYVHLEKDTNKLLGWYDSQIHKEIPTPNIEVSDEVWQDAISINANCYEGGKFIVKDFRTDEEVAAELVAHTKADALAYLAITDWYVTRKAETGVEIPEEVSRLRAEARLVA